MSESVRSAVRERRQDYPIRIYELDDQPGENLSDSTSAEERLAMVWELTVEAWNFAGLPRPDYPRDQVPLTCELRPISGQEN